MKKTRGLSLILCITMLLSMLNFSAYAQNTITAYITISKYGDIVTDKNGDLVAEAPVELTGSESYTLDDVFIKAHDLYYDGGAEASYATEVGDLGAYVSKAWGVSGTNFGYQINGGTVSVSGPTQAVNDGDFIDLCVYENYYPQTESYAKFDTYKKNINSDTAEFTLYESYYGPNWETLFRPCSGATIFVDGAETDIITDEKGKCNVTFYSNGNHLLSARKTKIVVNPMTEENETKPAITAPVCIVNVSMPDEIAVLHNMIKALTSGNLSDESQLRWLLADIGGYYKLYPHTKNVISDEEKQECIVKLADIADQATEANDFAGIIIGLSAIGCDPRNVYNSNNEQVDVVGKLSDLIDEASLSVTSIYFLPYVIIAMRDYASGEQMNMLINAALSQQDGEYGWLESSWGTDAATPMLVALAPYYETNSAIKNALLKAVDLVKEKQGDSGAVQCADWYTGDWIDSVCSTGLAIAGVSAIGIDPETITKNGNSLIDGLMTYANNELDNIGNNPFDYEQALRGIVTWQLAKPFKTGETVRQSRITNTQTDRNKDEEDEEGTISVTVKIMTHNEKECNNSYTYKNNSSKYDELVAKTVELDKGKTVYDATVKVLDENGIAYVDKSGYIASIGDFVEKGHGKNSGWMFLVDGKHKNSGAKDIKLKKDATILWYYTDDYTRESGSENFVNTNEEKDNNSANESGETQQKERVFQKDTFTDVKENDWHFSAVKFVYENNLMSGTDKGFEPDAKMTRAMLVSVLYRLAGAEKTETDIKFADVKDGQWYTDGILWAASVGIVSGVGDDSFAPDAEITREQMAVILYNFAMLNSEENEQVENDKVTEFEDYLEVSDYAKDAISWANAEGFISGESENTLNPKNSATRAQIASLLMRYCEAVNK